LSDRLLSEEALSSLVQLRHWLHRHPETGFDVGNTAAALAERLSAAGLAITTGIAGHGFVATLRCGSGSRAIGLRADMDALPIAEAGDAPYSSEVGGSFHGCGHDGHSAMLLGAALHLAEHGGFDGVVHFIFQPDEENGRGALAMIEDGLFERFPMEAVYGMHNIPGMPLGEFATRPGAMTAFEETFEIRIEGRGGHASAPERAIDPLVVGAETVLALQNIVSRALSPADHGVVSITEFVTDGARNIIPSVVTLRGDTRGYSDTVSEVISRRMAEIVHGVAAAHGAKATLRYTREFEPVVNTAAEVGKAAAAVAGIAGARMDAQCERFGFSEDFAQFLRHRPGCYVAMGNGTQGVHAQSLHNPHYDFNDEALAFGAEYWVRLVREELPA
jgi:amidohydrolase